MERGCALDTAGAFLLAALLAGCSRHGDGDVQKLVDDLGALDDAVISVVQAEPNATGLGKVEAMIATKGPSLHGRFVELDQPGPTPAASLALVNAAAKNTGAGQVARGCVYNAVLKSDPALRARAQKMAASLCAISALPDDRSSCVIFQGD